MSSSLRAPSRLESWRDSRSRLIRVGTGGLASLAAGFLLFATSAQAATAPVNLGSDSSFSVLAGSTVTNTGPTTMADDLGLDPGSSITGAPATLGSVHIDDGVATQAQSDLVTAINDAAGRPSTPMTGADLSSQNFTPGVYSTSSSLLFSAGSVTLNAEGDPNAVFIFQIGSSMTTSSATSVLLTNGAQPCNVFWEVGASVTLGSNSTFAGTVMAQTTITAGTGATLDGRLLAQTGAVNLDSNTITTSACATPVGGSSGTSTSAGTAGSTTTGTPSTTGTHGTTGTPGTTKTHGTYGATTSNKPASTARSASSAKAKKLAAKRRAHRLAAQRRARAARLAKERRLKLARLKRERAHPHSPAHPLKSPGGFTG